MEVVGGSDAEGDNGSLMKWMRERVLEGQRGKGAESRGKEGGANSTRQKANEMLMSLLSL